MEDEYLSFKCDYKNINWLKELKLKNGTLISIEYDDRIVYGIIINNNCIQYHNLNGIAVKSKIYKGNNYYLDQYFIYGKFMGFLEQMTFEEFKIRRDKRLKEMVFG